MKKYLFTIALLSSQIIIVAQTVNVHFKNGQQIQYSTNDVDFVDFSEKFEDTPGGNGPVSYTIEGKTYSTVLVNGGDIAPFYIMQTEIIPDKPIVVGYDEISLLDVNKNGVLIKTELRSFLLDIREKTGLPWRLPTKEEWMFAASGGAKSHGYTYSGSNSIADVAWYKDNSQSKAHDIAGKKSNELGLYDMSGNYAELVLDESSSGDDYSVDGNYYGGSWKDNASECKVTSYKEGTRTGVVAPGSSTSEKNAVSCAAVSVRLVYTK
jgi:hypothetical protein